MAWDNGMTSGTRSSPEGLVNISSADKNVQYGSHILLHHNKGIQQWDTKELHMCAFFLESSQRFCKMHARYITLVDIAFTIAFTLNNNLHLNSQSPQMCNNFHQQDYAQCIINNCTQKYYTAKGLYTSVYSSVMVRYLPTHSTHMGLDCKSPSLTSLYSKSNTQPCYGSICIWKRSKPTSSVPMAGVYSFGGKFHILPLSYFKKQLNMLTEAKWIDAALIIILLFCFFLHNLSEQQEKVYIPIILH